MSPRIPSRLATLVATILLALGAVAPSLGHADIANAERQVLLDLYTRTNGADWVNNTNWNGVAGTECTWYGITCDEAGNNVVAVDLHIDNLTGSLPEIAGLRALRSFKVYNNQLTGAIPPLAGLTFLQEFSVHDNQLTGPIPSLAGLSALRVFHVNGNQLEGVIPPLAGLVALRAFWADNNRLTGLIPSLAGLGALTEFNVQGNQLAGDAPAVPAPTNCLAAGGSTLCPNALNPAPDAGWDAATGSVPWYGACPSVPRP